MANELRDEILKRLDETLEELIVANDEEASARRLHDAATQSAASLSETARRMRLAVYAINGEQGAYGDADSANAKRVRELRRGEAS